MKKHLKHAKPDAAINDEVQPAPAGPQPTTTDAAPTGEPPTAAQPQEAAPPDQTHTTPPQEQIPAEELKALRERAAKADEYWDRLLRTAAELENFKKRVARERQETIKFATESLIQKLIPVLDNFETALAESQNAQHEAVKVFYTGVAMIHQQLRNVLESAGLEEIDARDKPFDPTLHEAIAQYDTTEVPDGHVFRQIRKGYKLNGRLIRPAGVIVARKPAAQQPDQPATEPIQTTNPGVERSQTT